MTELRCQKCGALHLFTDDVCLSRERLKRHVSTLCALLSGVKVHAALDEVGRSVRDTIKKELGE
jgi:hypothetical protein